MHIVDLIQWVQSSGNTGKHKKPYVNCQWYGLPLMRESSKAKQELLKIAQVLSIQCLGTLLYGLQLWLLLLLFNNSVFKKIKLKYTERHLPDNILAAIVE